MLWRTIVCAGVVALAACGGGGSDTSAESGSTNSGVSTGDSSVGSAGGSSGGGTTTTPGIVALSAATYSAGQTAGSVIITLNRTGGSDGAASVHYGTADGSAVAGTNYSSKSGMLSWTTGDAAAKSFAVALSSTAFTGNKTFTVALSAVTGATVGSMKSAAVTIVGSGTSGGGAGSGPAALLAAKLGAPSRLLFGLGGQGSYDQRGEIQQQSIKVDIYDRYLIGVWPTYNSAPCDYVCVVSREADADCPLTSARAGRANFAPVAWSARIVCRSLTQI